MDHGFNHGKGFAVMYLIIKRNNKYIAIDQKDLIVNGQVVQVMLQVSTIELAESVANDLNKIFNANRL